MYSRCPRLCLMLQECHLCGLCMPSICSWTLITLGKSVDGINPQVASLWDWLLPQYTSCCVGGWPRGAVFAPSGSGTCLDHPLGTLLVGSISWCSVVVWRWPLGILVLKPLWRGSHEGQCQLPPVTSPGLPGRSYRIIWGCRISVLNLEMCGKAMLLTEASWHQYLDYIF